MTGCLCAKSLTENVDNSVIGLVSSMTKKAPKVKKKKTFKNLNNKIYNSRVKIILNNKTKNKKETLGAVTEMQHLFSPFEKECSVSVDNMKKTNRFIFNKYCLLRVLG